MPPLDSADWLLWTKTGAAGHCSFVCCQGYLPDMHEDGRHRGRWRDASTVSGTMQEEWYGAYPTGVEASKPFLQGSDICYGRRFLLMQRDALITLVALQMEMSQDQLGAHIKSRSNSLE